MSVVDGPLGEIASVVLYENDAVRIWNLIVEPGESSDWHFHENDYVTVVLEGGGLTVEYDDGSREDGSAAVGDWRFHGEHRTHRVHNTTDTRYKNLLIELKS